MQHSTYSTYICPLLYVHRTRQEYVDKHIITDADGFHPNLVIRTGLINLLLNIAYNMKVQ